MAAALNVFFLGGLGSAIGPFVVGFTSDATGDLHLAMGLPAAGLLLAALLVAIAGRLARPAGGAPLARASEV
jgi:hypothetical protein